VGGYHLFRSTFAADLNRLAGNLSGGQRKMLSAALSLETGATVVLLDEPEAGLDPANLDSLAEMLVAAKAAGRSLVVSAHQPSQKLATIADQIYWLYEGRLHLGPQSLSRRVRAPYNDSLTAALHEEQRHPASLRVSGMKIHRDGLKVLDDVTFDLKPGQFLSVSGPNGSGKSSLALSLMGLIQADGEIELDGIRVDRLQTYRRVKLGMSFMPQAPHGLFYNLTVEENIRSIGPLGSSAEHDLEWTWETFHELFSLRGQLARRLSGGLQRLLTLAMSVRQNPRLLILDEPLAGLAGGEGGVAQRVVDLIGTLVGRTTVLIFEHRVQEISATGFRHLSISDLARRNQEVR
jgi:branched-chain amino acid transport system ATP-binding protein